MCRARRWPLFLALVACASAALAQGTAALRDYRIGPRDVVKISVAETEDFNAEDLRVGGDGMIVLPRVGRILIEGLTATEAADEIAQALEEFLRTATVSVEVTEFLSRPIMVIGAVENPQSLPFPGRWNLLDALMEAGGITEAAGRTVRVVRRAENGLTDQLDIDLKALLEAEPSRNIPILANDIVTVSTAAKVTILMMGAIGSPGLLEFRDTERLTVLTALAKAGGPSDRASNKILLRRPGSDGSLIQTRFDYKKLLSGAQANAELRDGDIIEVKESFF